MNAEIKQRGCRNCGEVFTQFNSMEPCCSPQCKREDKARKAAKKETKLENMGMVPASQIKAPRKQSELAQSAVNGYVNLRDYSKPCITCNSFETRMDVWEAGHFRSVGSAPHLRFNLKNIHKQCNHCNQVLSGNSRHYKIGIVERIGYEEAEKLKNTNGIRRYDDEYYKRITRIFKKKRERLRHRILKKKGLL